jgi:integrase
MKYANNLYLTDLSDVSKTIYQAGQRYIKWVNKQESPRGIKSPAYLVKLFYLDYLTGARIGEMLREPYPKLQRDKINRHEIVIVTKINQKHWKSKKEGLREMMIQMIPIRGPYETAMWEYVTDEWGNTNTGSWLSSFGGYKARNSITNRFKHHFKATLTDGSNIYEDRGIPPHVLRHLRAYNLLLNRGYEESFIQVFFGWSRKAMLEHYTYIKLALQGKQLKQMVERMLGDSDDDE